MNDPDLNPVPLVQNPPVDRVAAVSVKAPVFWKANPALWFCQLEAQFENSRILVDRTKYMTAVAAIESSVLSQVSDIVLNPPADNMYGTLKARLLERYADSDESRLRKLLTGMSLGDKRPSYLLREMKDLAGNGLGDAALRSLWLQHLPSQCQAILSVSADENDKLAVMADKICEVSSSVPNNVYAMSSSRPVASTFASNAVVEIEKTMSDKIDFLCKQVARIDDLSRQVANFGRSRSKSGSRSTTKSRFNKGSDVSVTKSDDILCWYHAKWGDKASRCRNPCKHFATFSEN